METTRRNFLKSAGALGAFSLLSAGFPKLSFANLPTDNRVILVILRGAMDGLAAVPPYADPHYKALRGSLAFEPPGDEDGLVDLNGYFGLHPSLAPLAPLYRQGQLAVVHAVASPYRERSHFDAQNLLENGTLKPGGTEGWLSRAMVAGGAENGAALALNEQIPLVLQGAYNASSWAPKAANVDMNGEYMRSVASLYTNDPLLGTAFKEGVRTQLAAEEALPKDDLFAAKGAKGSEQLASAAQAAAGFLAKETGPRVAVLEAAGWDTHARQGTTSGNLAQRLADLAKALALLPGALGPVWKKTVVVVVTEFGRTVAENGTGGTDHGTGGVALVLGGRVNGGKVLGQWPTLGNLYQGRDLMPTTDMRSIFKTVLAAHLGISSQALESTIFPDSADAGLMHTLLA